MIISIASGKGGTGKTTLAVNLAYHIANSSKVSLIDCDVEEPNDHLFLNVENFNSTTVTVPNPVFDEEKCKACGQCVDACNFNALALVGEKPLIFNELCHSCGACCFICPSNAINEEPHEIGQILTPTGNRLPFDFAYGLLNIGETLAPEIIKKLKQRYISAESINIIDSAPGTGCSVVESLNGAHSAVLVTEPTPFGLHDLQLAVKLSLKMKIPTGIVINRSDGNDDLIVEFAQKAQVPILGRIPFDRKYAESYSRGEILINRFVEFKERMKEIYENILKLRDSQIPDSILKEGIKSKVYSPSETVTPSTALDVKEIVVISGKGGTGKTTITASLAQLAQNQTLFDADVDAADLQLLIKPTKTEIYGFSGGKEAVIDVDKCFGCGNCAELCRFDAIDLNGPANDLIAQTYLVDNAKCEGCGLCTEVCPVDAITLHDSYNGKWMRSETSCGTMIHAELGIGEENSGKLVSVVRSAARINANQKKLQQIIGDGPPGTGCPVIASVTGADTVIVVTEPTVSGMHDLERVLKLTRHFKIKSLVIINKADINTEITEQIYSVAWEYGNKVIAEIPFDRNVHDALMAGKTIIEYGKGEAFKIIKTLWEKMAEE